MGALYESGGLMLLALLPGICEELLFRGAVLGLLARRGRPWLAVALQAVLFGLVHIYAFKLLPTMTLGLLLGALAVRSRSVWPGVAVHLLNNAAALVLFSAGWSLEEVHWGALAALGAAGFAAAWLTRCPGTPARSGP